MKYLLAIYCNEETDAKQSQAEQSDVMNRYFAFSNSVQEAGVYVAGEALHPSSTATTVRVRDGKTLTTDGPFAESKEQFGGFYLVDCKNLDEAIQWAAKIPHAAQSAIEIRPVVDFSQVATA